jgi:glutamate synthase (NADPH/NADH) small chain
MQLCLAGGSEQPRDFNAPGRELNGIHLRDGFPDPAESARSRPENPPDQEISATDKHVIVIGGGDTGSDCVGTSIRQGARSVTQLEIMPQAATA